MTDDDVPEGYSRPVNPRMMKAPPPEARAAATTTNDDDDEVDKTVKTFAGSTASQAPAAPDHGRPRGANNALAFHQFKKSPKPDDAG